LLDWSLQPLLDAGHDPRSIRVLDPACGPGNFLVAAARRLGTAENVVGVDSDVRAVERCRVALGRDARVEVGDAFSADLEDGSFDVVVGNPPFLTPLRTATVTEKAARITRLGSRLPPYVDESALFLVLATRLARSDGGRVALVQPLATLATRDGGWARSAAVEDAALEHLWIATEPVFAASVLTCAVGLCRGQAQGSVSRILGDVVLPRRPLPTDSWSPLLADAFGVPSVTVTGDERIGEVAQVTADFRDEYYEVASLVQEGGEGAPVITSGLIEPGHTRWGEHATTIARRRFTHPTVREAALSDRLRARLVPKVLVATQTMVIEAAVDEQGAWVPLVPVISVVAERDRLWHVAAALCSPPLTAHAATLRLGAARSAAALKLSASDVRGLPLPPASDAWDRAALALRNGDLLASGRLMCEAYGVGDEAFTWWAARLPRRAGGKR
jgi:SAM-dependent methyltransferase